MILNQNFFKPIFYNNFMVKNTKVLYLEAKRTRQSLPEMNTKVLSKLPKELFIAYSIQYKALASDVKAYLSTKKHKIQGFKQVLGCSKLKTKAPLLLIGSGRFHALGLALQNEVPIYIYNNNQIETIDKKQIELLKKRKQAALSKFLMANKIGILVSTKPGQDRKKDAEALKKKLELKGKNVYFFVSNNLNLSDLENFFIDSWVNTACPGLAYDTPKLINIDDLSSIKY